MAFVTRNSGTEDDAADMLQEALVIVWERVRSGRFEHSAKLSTFIFGIVKNLWSRQLLQHRREIVADVEDHTPNGNVSPLDAIIESERVDTVRIAMGRMGELCKRLLLMFYWEEKSMEDIARVLGFANANTAKAKKYQCKKELERWLRKPEEP